jgi:hypothetical protein
LRELSVGVTGEQLMMTREEELDFIYKFVVDRRKEGRKIATSMKQKSL